MNHHTHEDTRKPQSAPFAVCHDHWCVEARPDHLGGRVYLRLPGRAESFTPHDARQLAHALTQAAQQLEQEA